MALARLKLFPEKGEVWIDGRQVAAVVDGKYPIGQSSLQNCLVTLATGKSLHVHGSAAFVSTQLRAAEKRK